MLQSDLGEGPFGWMSQGACQREDPELFFPLSAKGAAQREIDAAKAVCRGCTVRSACLSFGLQSSEEGIWGGTTPEERHALRRQPAPLLPTRRRIHRTSV